MNVTRTYHSTISSATILPTEIKANLGKPENPSHFVSKTLYPLPNMSKLVANKHWDLEKLTCF